MGTVGIVHTVFACLALAFGAAVVAARKGTRFHRTVGHVYFSSMLGVNVTAFFLYGLLGRMGPFHILAMVSVATLFAGMIPVLSHRPRGRWFEYHARFMAWSYVGLLAAAAAEFTARLPGVPFVWSVLGASLGVTLAGAAVIHGRGGARIEAAIRRSGIAAPPERTPLRTIVLLALLCCTAVAAPAQSADLSVRRDSAIALLDRSVILHDREQLMRANARFEQLHRAAPEDGLALFWLGYALYRLAESPRVSGEGRRSAELLDSATTVLRRSAELHPLPETFALLGTITGRRMEGSMWRALLTASQWERELDTAERLGPTNPRVLLLRGINAYHAPSRFGGVDAAKRYLEAAVAAFADDRPATGLPAWGHAEALAWLGRVYARTGERRRAQQAYRAALEIEPEYRWVRDVLLPGLDRR